MYMEIQIISYMRCFIGCNTNPSWLVEGGVEYMSSYIYMEIINGGGGEGVVSGKNKNN